MSRYRKYRKQKGGAVKVAFKAPVVQHGSAEQAMQEQQQQTKLAGQQQAQKNAMLSGGSVVVPQMTQGGSEGNSAIKASLKQDLQAKADQEFDTPPKLKGGRRKRTRRKKRNKRRKSRRKRTKRRKTRRKKRTKRRKTRRKRRRK